MRHSGTRRSLLAQPDGFTPKKLSGLIGFWEASNSILSGGNVVTVPDSSGNGKTLTANNTVPYNATGLNGRPSWSFVAANTASMTNAAFTGLGTGTTGTAWAVGRLETNTTNNGTIVSFVGDAGGADASSAGSVYWIGRNGTNNGIKVLQTGGLVGTIALSLTTTYLIISVFDGANHTVYANSTSDTVANSHSWANAISLLSIGSRINGGVSPTVAYWEGAVSAVGITNTAMSAIDRALLLAWATSKYGAV